MGVLAAFRQNGSCVPEQLQTVAARSFVACVEGRWFRSYRTTNVLLPLQRTATPRHPRIERSGMPWLPIGGQALPGYALLRASGVRNDGQNVFASLTAETA
jgi:hypothetical protein